MNESHDIVPNQQEESADAFLDGVLEAMSKYFEARIESISKDKELLEFGAKTAAVVEIENMIKHPVEEMDRSIGKLKTNAFRILNGAAKNIFSKYSEAIYKVVRTDAPTALHYSIALKEDSPEMRFQLLRILDGYETMGYSRSFPMYFQFVSKEFIGQIPYTEILLEPQPANE